MTMITQHRIVFGRLGGSNIKSIPFLSSKKALKLANYLVHVFLERTDHPFRPTTIFNGQRFEQHNFFVEYREEEVAVQEEDVFS